MQGTRQAVPAFDDRAPADRYCDLILTGGVTSSIAYPGAVFALAMAYRLQSIGGSSSGAGVAALAAAAEYRRRKGSPEGYRLLLERTDAVADVCTNGKTGLESLFVPAPGHGRLFEALLAVFAVTRPGVPGRFAIAWAFLKSYLLDPLLAIALAAAGVRLIAGTWQWGTLGYVAFAAVALIAAVLCIAFAFYRDLARLAAHDFGLCTGTPEGAGGEPARSANASPDAPPPPPPALTLWLHRLIQEVAGRGEDDAPLTFADLHAAPGGPRETLADFSRAGRASIQLKVFTASLTHGRPYLLPLTDDDPAFYFTVAEMRALFPVAVVRHLVTHGEPVAADHPGAGAAPATDEEHTLRRLPRDALPVVVATRMSVAFPVLFTAVPLWMWDEDIGSASKRTPRWRRVLLSDGGLCSNFPIHLFDSPLPSWPTFGISLHDTDRQPENFSAHDPYDPVFDKFVDAPTAGHADRGERWHGFAEADKPFGRIVGFAGAALGTMKDWSDAALARLPGVRDRVAQIRLPPGIGGLNLRMKTDQIRWLAALGVAGVRTLLDRYARCDSTSGQASGWLEHRLVRLELLAETLGSSFEGLAWSASRSRHAQPLAEQLRDGAADDPARAAALQGVLETLMQTERALRARADRPRPALRPRPQWRLRPPM